MRSWKYDLWEFHLSFLLRFDVVVVVVDPLKLGLCLGLQGMASWGSLVVVKVAAAVMVAAAVVVVVADAAAVAAVENATAELEDEELLDTVAAAVAEPVEEQVSAGSQNSVAEEDLESEEAEACEDSDDTADTDYCTPDEVADGDDYNGDIPAADILGLVLEDDIPVAVAAADGKADDTFDIDVASSPPPP